MTQPSAYTSRKRRSRRYGKKTAKVMPKIFFCGDPHGDFEHINRAVLEHKPDAVVMLGDMQPYDDIDKILAPALELTQVWWIPGNHDSDTEEFYDRLWHGALAAHNLHGKVANICGIRIAGLGGVFRGQIWMPEDEPNYRSASSFVRRNGRVTLWRGGLPRRHRTSIFPSVYEGLCKQHADVLITHEAAGCHKKGFEAIDRLAKSLHVRWLFHGHQHEDRVYGVYKGMIVRGVGYRGIVDLEGNDIVPAQIDPRDLLVMQQAGEEPAPEVFDSVTFSPMPYAEARQMRRRRYYKNSPGKTATRAVHGGSDPMKDQYPSKPGKE